MTNQQNIDAWSQVPSSVLQEFGDEGDFGRQHLLNPHIFRLLGNIQGKTILDAGCGNGYLSRKMAKLGAIVTGVEPAQSLFQAAQKNEGDRPLGITYLQQDLSQYQAPNTFDIVVSNMVFMDIPDWKTAFGNCVTALKDNGQFIFSISHPCFENSDSEYSTSHSIQITEYFKEYSKVMSYGHGFHRPISTYINFMLTHGCKVSEIVEPQLNSEFDHLKDAHIPSYFIVSAIKSIS